MPWDAMGCLGMPWDVPRFDRPRPPGAQSGAWIGDKLYVGLPAGFGGSEVTGGFPCAPMAGWIWMDLDGSKSENHMDDLGCFPMGWTTSICDLAWKTL